MFAFHCSPSATSLLLSELPVCFDCGVARKRSGRDTRQKHIIITLLLECLNRKEAGQKENTNARVRCHCLVSLPDDRVFEAQLGGGLLDLLLQPGLRPHQVLDKLGHPPD